MILPGTVLFPNTVLPLRIFEPRYRAMLRWALENDRMFCVALMKPGITEAETEEDFFHTAGIGLVAASITQADGTSNLMLNGIARVRFTGFRKGEPFRVAKTELLRDIDGDREVGMTLADSLRAQCKAILAGNSELPESFTDILGRIPDPGDLADGVAHALVADALQRQSLLEQREIPKRLRELSQILGIDFPTA